MSLPQNWDRRLVVLTDEALKRILSICQKFGARSSRISPGGIYIRADAETCASIRGSVSEVLENEASWKRVLRHAKFPSEMITSSGNGDSRAWNYELRNWQGMEFAMYDASGQTVIKTPLEFHRHGLAGINFDQLKIESGDYVIVWRSPGTIVGHPRHT